jgi:hypothetical protein
MEDTKVTNQPEGREGNQGKADAENGVETGE